MAKTPSPFDRLAESSVPRSGETGDFSNQAHQTLRAWIPTVELPRERARRMVSLLVRTCVQFCADPWKSRSIGWKSWSSSRTDKIPSGNDPRPPVYHSKPDLNPNRPHQTPIALFLIETRIPLTYKRLPTRTCKTPIPSP